MSLAKTHDELAIRSFFPVAIAGYVAVAYFGLPLGLSAIAVLTTPIAGLICSPDMDIRSKPYLRWGLLRWYWLPYQKLSSHRGLSHAPLFGSAGRVGYLLPIAWLGLAIQGMDAIAILKEQWQVVAAIWVGAEIAALVHLMADSKLWKIGSSLWKSGKR